MLTIWGTREHMRNIQSGGQVQPNILSDVVLPIVFTIITFACLVQLVMIGLEQLANQETVTAISAFAS